MDVATAGAVEDDAPPELRRDLLRRPAPRLVHGVGQLVGILGADMIAADEREKTEKKVRLNSEAYIHTHIITYSVIAHPHAGIHTCTHATHINVLSTFTA